MNEEALRATKEAVARNVAALRQAKGMNQTELAIQAGLVQQKISQIENATENLTLATMAKVANALGVDVAMLLRGEK